MSLSGNLGFVPIDEVLRLLTRSHQQGSVDVTGSGFRGRVFVGKSGIDLATTYDDDELHTHLVNSRYADEKVLNRITSGETTLAAVTESNSALIDLLREMSVESLFQIADRGRDFQVQEHVTTPYASPTSFELEALLRDAEQRRKEWDKVTDVIPNLTDPVTFHRDLGDREEVTVKVDDWKVLSEIGAGSSVQRIAEHLGTTEFWTAKITARLVNNDLVVVASQAATIEEPVETEIRYEPPVEEEAPADEYAAYEAEKAAGESTEEAAVESPFGDSPADGGDEDVDPDESWWQEPRDEAEVEEEDSDSKTPEVVSEGLSEMPTVDSSEPDPDSEVEEDTEAFLEKVFSELESTEASDEDDDSSESENDEGHGLLRRRRMGTLRDFSSDS